MIISLFKTSGHSMEPEITNGSFFIASSIPFLLAKPKVGDIILFGKNKKTIVKKIKSS